MKKNTAKSYQLNIDVNSDELDSDMESYHSE